MEAGDQINREKEKNQDTGCVDLQFIIIYHNEYSYLNVSKSF